MVLLVKCPNCGTHVVPKSNGQCPACQKENIQDLIRLAERSGGQINDRVGGPSAPASASPDKYRSPARNSIFLVLLLIVIVCAALVIWNRDDLPGTLVDNADKAWSRAMGWDSADAYREFYEGYPESPHAEEAKARYIRLHWPPLPKEVEEGPLLTSPTASDDSESRFLLHDRDSIYGEPFHRTVKAMCIEEVRTASTSPWQNPYCERVIGSIRREYLDRVIILGEKHLCRIMKDYLEYYHQSRPHLALDQNCPTPRVIESPSEGEVISIPKVGGLHRLYTWAG